MIKTKDLRNKHKEHNQGIKRTPHPVQARQFGWKNLIVTLNEKLQIYPKQLIQIINIKITLKGKRATVKKSFAFAKKYHLEKNTFCKVFFAVFSGKRKFFFEEKYIFGQMNPLGLNILFRNGPFYGLHWTNNFRWLSNVKFVLWIDSFAVHRIF